MRWRGNLVAITAALTVLGAPAATADETITASFSNRYDNANVTIDQGEALNFRNNDIVRHDVYSTQPGDVNDRLFASDTIGNGETSFVEGTQYLTTGTYDFLCSVHPDQMTGKITVTSAGTPKPRPGSNPAEPPPADITGPLLRLTASPAKASKLKKGKGFKFGVSVNEAAKLTITLELKGKKVAGREIEFGSPGSRKETLRVAKKSRSKLKKGTKLKLTATATDAAGNATPAELTIRLT